MSLKNRIRGSVARLMRSKIWRIQSAMSVENRILIATSAINSMRVRAPYIRHLWEAEVRVFSQWGEDGILTYLLDSIGISKPRIFEIGAGNFEECNSRFQAEFRNASVYAVDLRSDLITNCQSLDVYWRSIIIPVNDLVSPDNVNLHLEKAAAHLGNLDVFSLDVDGNDYWILHAAELSKVSIVVCEYNPLFGHKASVTIPRNDNFSRETEHYSWLYYGMSLRACIQELSKKGFDFCGVNIAGNNAFFIRKDLVKKLQLDFPNIDDLSAFTDWRVREGRYPNGQLSYLFGDERSELIQNQEVFDIERNKLIPLTEVL